MTMIATSKIVLGGGKDERKVFLPGDDLSALDEDVVMDLEADGLAKDTDAGVNKDEGDSTPKPGAKTAVKAKAKVSASESTGNL